MIWLLVSFCLLQASPTQAPAREAAPPSHATGAIRGRVTDRESGMPLSGIATAGRMVVVWLFPTDGTRRAAVTSRSTMIVRPGGTFTLGPVRSGEYYVVATVGSPFDSSASMSNWDRLARVAERIALGEGDRRTIDLRVVTLPEGGWAP